MLGEPDGLTDDQLAALRALSPRYAEACAELEAAAIGSSIQHDDLHDGNVLAGDGGYRVIDWGDSGVAHPFATLLVTLRSVGNAFELGDWTPFGPAVPELERLRDAYQETQAEDSGLTPSAFARRRRARQIVETAVEEGEPGSQGEGE